MLNAETQHKPRHDLESILYVLVYICCLYCGPNDTLKRGTIPEFLVYWLYTESRAHFTDKHTFLTIDGPTFFFQYTSQFADYFKDFAGIVDQLRRVFRPDSVNLLEDAPGATNMTVYETLYQSVIQILMQGRTTVSEPARKPSKKPVRVALDLTTLSAKTTGKRKRHVEHLFQDAFPMVKSTTVLRRSRAQTSTAPQTPRSRAQEAAERAARRDRRRAYEAAEEADQLPRIRKAKLMRLMTNDEDYPARHTRLQTSMHTDEF